MAQGVVDINAEDAFAVFFLLVEVGHQVETLVAVEAVVVAAFDMGNRRRVIIAGP